MTLIWLLPYNEIVYEDFTMGDIDGAERVCTLQSTLLSLKLSIIWFVPTEHWLYRGPMLPL
jgi:hypothetical protein